MKPSAPGSSLGSGIRSLRGAGQTFLPTLSFKTKSVCHHLNGPIHAFFVVVQNWLQNEKALCNIFPLISELSNTVI